MREFIEACTFVITRLQCKVPMPSVALLSEAWHRYVQGWPAATSRPARSSATERERVRIDGFAPWQLTYGRIDSATPYTHRSPGLLTRHKLAIGAIRMYKADISYSLAFYHIYSCAPLHIFLCTAHRCFLSTFSLLVCSSARLCSYVQHLIVSVHLSLSGVDRLRHQLRRRLHHIRFVAFSLSSSSRLDLFHTQVGPFGPQQPAGAY